MQMLGNDVYVNKGLKDTLHTILFAPCVLYCIATIIFVILFDNIRLLNILFIYTLQALY